MTNDLRWIAPIPSQPDYEVLEAHRLTREFHDEIHHRQTHENYCQWYATVAEQNRRDLQKMQRDFNFLGWFYRGRYR